MLCLHRILRSFFCFRVDDEGGCEQGKDLSSNKKLDRKDSDLALHQDGGMDAKVCLASCRVLHFPLHQRHCGTESEGEKVKWEVEAH